MTWTQAGQLTYAEISALTDRINKQQSAATPNPSGEVRLPNGLIAKPH